MFAAGACANRLVVASGLTSLTGTLFGDLIIGSDRADRISAGAGDDCLEGRAGNDGLGATPRRGSACSRCARRDAPRGDRTPVAAETATAGGRAA
jgi:hypothetical protein